MSIFLQDKKTGLYFQSPAVWTEEMEEAFDFESSDRANACARSQHVVGAQVVAVFRSSGYVDSVNLPIGISSPWSAARIPVGENPVSLAR
jgi:hypothetical protein